MYQRGVPEWDIESLGMLGWGDWWHLSSGEGASPYKPYKNRGEIKHTAGKGCADALPDMQCPVRVRCTLTLMNCWIRDVRRSVATRTCQSCIRIQSMRIICYHEVKQNTLGWQLHCTQVDFSMFRFCIPFPIRLATDLIFVSASLLSLYNFISMTLSVRLPQNKCRKVPPK